MSLSCNSAGRLPCAHIRPHPDTPWSLLTGQIRDPSLEPREEVLPRKQAGELTLAAAALGPVVKQAAFQLRALDQDEGDNG